MAHLPLLPRVDVLFDICKDADMVRFIGISNTILRLFSVWHLFLKRTTRLVFYNLEFNMLHFFTKMCPGPLRAQCVTVTKSFQKKHLILSSNFPHDAVYYLISILYLPDCAHGQNKTSWVIFVKPQPE